MACRFGLGSHVCCLSQIPIERRKHAGRTLANVKQAVHARSCCRTYRISDGGIVQLPAAMIFRNRSLMGAALCLLVLIIFLLAQAHEGSFASILATSSLKKSPQAALTQLTTHIVLFKFKDGVAPADLKDVKTLHLKQRRIVDSVHRSPCKCSASKSHASTLPLEHRISSP
ncbi:hypothetical protein DPSP01_008962 [Paraphaeosphaeria sporulosa]